MRAAAGALSTFEVAVRRGRRALSGMQDVRVHAEAHRATGTAPLCTGATKDLVEAFVFSGRLHRHRARYDEHAHSVSHLVSVQNLSDRPQVLDPAVGAGPDEDH